MFTDTHCHITKEYYDNPEGVIKIAEKNNVHKIIISSCELQSLKESLELCRKNKNLYVVIGIHPNNTKEFEKGFKLIEKHLNNSKVIGIGEIGLDYHYDGYNKGKQIKMFEDFLSLAERYNKKVVIHSRDAGEDTYNILKKYNVKGVIHSFQGDVTLAQKYINLGYMIGINGTITYKNSNLVELVKSIPLKKILLETDSPYLSPTPLRGTKNEPKNIMIIAKFLSNILNISLNDLALILDDNVKSLFDI